MVWDPITLIVLNTPFCPFCYTSFILPMCIRLIGMRLLFCCSDHDIQYGELIVANKSGITVKFTDTNSISCVSTAELTLRSDKSVTCLHWITIISFQRHVNYLKDWKPCQHATHATHAITPPMRNHVTMPLHHLCATMPPFHPCHHTTHAQPCHPCHLCHYTTYVQPCHHATHAVCCIIVFCCWLRFASVPFYQNWVSAAVVQVNVIERVYDTVTPDARECWCHRASMWWGINVIGHQCDRASMWLGNNVIGHQCDRASMWSRKFNIFLYLFQNIHTIA